MSEKLDDLSVLINDLLNEYDVEMRAREDYDCVGIELYDTGTGKSQLFEYESYKPEPCPDGTHRFTRFNGYYPPAWGQGHRLVWSCEKCATTTDETHHPGSSELIANGHMRVWYCDHLDQGCKQPILKKELV